MKIAVLLGGSSAERAVSLCSGAQVAVALLERGHEVLALDPTEGFLPLVRIEALAQAEIEGTPPRLDAPGDSARKAARWLQKLAEVPGLDLAFLALHGGQGEDGTYQALLELLGVPFSGSGALASGIAMDKNLTKRIVRDAGIPTAAWFMAPVQAETLEHVLGFPVVVKPSRQGSTVGLSVVEEAGALEAALRLAYQHDRSVMLERYVPGREFTVGILGDRALPVGEIRVDRAVFDYEAKYQAGQAREIFPAELEEGQAQALQELALRAHRALGLRGYSRVDFRQGEDGVFYCLEANTLPGMTPNSLLPQAARAEGLSFADLCEAICRLAFVGS